MCACACVKQGPVGTEGMFREGSKDVRLSIKGQTREMCLTFSSNRVVCDCNSFEHHACHCAALQACL